MMYRTMILTTVLFSLIQSIRPAAYSQSNITHGPYISQATQTSIIISWKTRIAASSSIEYGRTSRYGTSAKNVNAATKNSITLSGLQPSTEYHYRIIAGDTTRDYTFNTAVRAGEPFVFAVYGDTRTNHNIHTAVLTLMQRYAPRFIINTGDLVSSSTESNWHRYFTILCKNTSVGETIPIYSAIGNHDNNSLRYFQYSHLPRNNRENSQSYYSFDYGSAHFIALNTLIDYDAGSPQYHWLVDDLSHARAAKLRFVFMHSPVYSSSFHGSNKKIQTILSPLFERYHVSIVFSGHDHVYERTHTMNGVVYVVTGGGGAPLYDFKSDNPWTAYKEKAYHFCMLSLDRSRCTFSMIRLDGVVRDSLIIH